MIIVRNIPGASKLLFSLPGLTKYKRAIDQGRRTGDLEMEKENMLKATRKWGRDFVQNFHIDLDIQGQEHLPREGAVVYVANHVGFADIPILCAALPHLPFGFVAKDDLGKIPFYGTWMKRIRGVMMKRDDPRASLKAIAQGIEHLKLGFSLVIFPEGTRSLGGDMKDFKKGSLKLATKARVPIVPITIQGTSAIYEDRGILSSAPVSVKIHPPIPTQGLSKEEEAGLSELVHETIKKAL